MWDTHQAGRRAQRAAHQRAERTHWSDDQREEWVNGTETRRGNWDTERVTRTVTARSVPISLLSEESLSGFGPLSLII